MIPKSNPKSKKKPPEMPVTAVSGAFLTGESPVPSLRKSKAQST